MRRSNKYFWIPLILIIILASTFFVTAFFYEKQASRSAIVNISKRVVAEIGGFISKSIFREKYSKNISFGPNGSNVLDSINRDAARYIENKFGSDAVNITELNDFKISEYAKSFQYEDLTNPKLQVLKESYNLNELTSGANREFDKILILRDWVKRAIPRGSPKNVDYNFNALDILKRAQQGEKFFCSEYSTVFVQCALSLGIIARYAGLFKGHVVAEVWSNEFAKWIVVDVDNDLHYERAGIPLDALEVHGIWENRDFSDVDAVQGLERIKLSEDKKEDLLSYYHEFYIRMRNDWFSNRYPHWHYKANSIMNGLEWQDEYTSNNVLIAREVRHREKIYFPLNITSAYIAEGKSSKNQLFLILDTFTPCYSMFFVKIDNSTIIEQKDRELIWVLHSGKNTLEVRAINSVGVKGWPLRIEIVI